jgi:hypothetical protein
MAIDEVGYSFNTSYITEDQFYRVLSIYDIDLDDLENDPYVSGRRILEKQLRNNCKLRIMDINNTPSIVYQAKIDYTRKFKHVYAIQLLTPHHENVSIDTLFSAANTRYINYWKAN